MNFLLVQRRKSLAAAVPSLSLHANGIFLNFPNKAIREETTQTCPECELTAGINSWQGRVSFPISSVPDTCIIIPPHSSPSERSLLCTPLTSLCPLQGCPQTVPWGPNSLPSYGLSFYFQGSQERSGLAQSWSDHHSWSNQLSPGGRALAVNVWALLGFGLGVPRGDSDTQGRPCLAAVSVQESTFEATIQCTCFLHAGRALSIGRVARTHNRNGES